MDTIHTIGIDLAKSVFQLCAFNRAGKKLFNKMLRRNQLLRFLSNIGPCLIGMEACRSQNESTFYSLANEFYEAAYQLGLIKVVNIKFYAVQLYLYGHASELFAKSILYSLGCNVKNIKKFGHNLEKLVKEAQGRGLVTQEFKAICAMSAMYEKKLLEYR